MPSAITGLHDFIMGSRRAPALRTIAIKFLLRASRYLIALATTIHLFTINGAIKQGTRSVKRAANATDAAAVSVTRASTVLNAAKTYHADARGVERAISREHNNFVQAAQIEASALRKGVVVGA